VKRAICHVIGKRGSFEEKGALCPKRHKGAFKRDGSEVDHQREGAQFPKKKKLFQ